MPPLAHPYHRAVGGLGHINARWESILKRLNVDDGDYPLEVDLLGREQMEHFADLSRKELLKLIRVYAKNWLAHDGCWFLAVEEKIGLNSAIEIDARAWQRFSVMEAKRIMAAFHIPPNGGLRALEKAFRFRLYSTVNRQQVEWVNDRVMIFRMIECRVQQARRRKNLPHFPCKPVGIVEYSQFAATIDSRIQTRCITCPPDPVADCHCAWEFSLKQKQ